MAGTGAGDSEPLQRRPARVMLVAPQAPPYGGMALQAELLARLLREDGHSVSFFASNFRFPPGLRILERIPGVRTLARYLLTWPKMWREGARVDVVHVFAASWLYFFAAVAPAVVVGKILGKRVVLNYRGGDAERFFQRWGFAVKLVIRSADVVTAPSRFLAEVIDRHCGISVVIVGNILDHSVFTFRERTAIRPRLVVARQLEEIYDIESVLRAFRALARRHENARLVVVGTGSQEERLRKLAAEWELRNVAFLGHVTHDDLPQIYAEADVFINASRVDNFPGALVEASAAGLALVSTASGGIPFMYQDRRDALLVPPGDWQGLADAVDAVLESPALARKLIRNGLAVAQSCDWKSVRKGVYETYGLSSTPERRAVQVGRI